MKTKLIFFALAASLALVGCKSKETNNDQLSPDLVNNPTSASGETGDVPVMEFQKNIHDFGTIKQGEKVSFSFKFKNTGKADLIIASASGSCGCTVPNFPKQPIAPGKEGVIDVTFDSSGKSGQQNKQVTVVANTIPNTTVLTVAGMITTDETKK